MTTYTVRIEDSAGATSGTFENPHAAVAFIMSLAQPVERGIRVWLIPPKPADVERVRDKDGDVIELRHVTEDGWVDLVAEGGPLTEVVETEVETAVRRLREKGYDDIGPAKQWTDRERRDVRIVLAHVLNGGSL